MIKKITILSIFFLMVNAVLNAQQMPIDFDEDSEVFQPFNGTSFSTRANPDDASDQVGEFFNDGSNPWQGAFLSVQRPIDLSTQQEILLDFYRFDPNAHNIVLKLEQGADSNPDVEVKVDLNAGSGNEWINDIVFDFSNAFISGTGNTINATGTYSRIVIFIDGGLNVGGTYLIDDIDDGSEPEDLNAIDVEYTQLVWSDEFDGTTIDTDKWHHQTFGPNGGRWFNGEEQHYTDSPTNSYVENGNLYIVAKKETTTQNGVTLDYTSARLNSKYAFTYGRVDIRAKLPKGAGTWPALWTLGKNITEEGAYWQTQGYGTTSWPACGELDIMEHGLHGVNEVSAAIHTPSSFGATVNTAYQLVSDVAENYHIYSMNWSPNQVTFLVDGEAFYTYNPTVKNADTWPFDLDQFLLLNIAMGGIAGTIDPNFTESPMIIDYVRVFQGANLSVNDEFSSQFTVYPNPVKGILKIQSDLDIEKLQLYSYTGQLVKLQEKDSKSINVSGLASGIYLLKIHANNQIASKKIIIE